MQNIKSKLHNNLIKNNQPIKLYCVFLLSVFLFKIFALIVQIFYPKFRWSDYEIFSNSFYLARDSYWDTIFIIFNSLAIPFLIIFILSFYLKYFKLQNLKYLFLFLSLGLIQYAFLESSLAFFMPIFEHGIAPTNNEIIILILIMLAIFAFFFFKMLKFDIFQNQERHQEKTKKFVINYLPWMLGIHLFIIFLIASSIFPLLEALSFGLMAIIFSVLTRFIIKFLYGKKFFLTKLLLSLPILYLIYSFFSSLIYMAFHGVNS